MIWIHSLFLKKKNFPKKKKNSKKNHFFPLTLAQITIIIVIIAENKILLVYLVFQDMCQNKRNIQKIKRFFNLSISRIQDFKFENRLKKIISKFPQKRNIFQT